MLRVKFQKLKELQSKKTKEWVDYIFFLVDFN
jgi:hypothetical protein